AHQVATLATRKPKDHSATAESLAAKWKSEAISVGFNDEAVDSCFGRDIALSINEAEVKDVFDLMKSPLGLTRYANSFARRDVIQSLIEATSAPLDAGTISELADKFCDEAGIVEVDIGNDI